MRVYMHCNTRIHAHTHIHTHTHSHTHTHQTLLAEAGTLKSFASAFGGSGAVPGTAANSLRPGAGRSITFTLDAPANLWGRQWLGMQDYLHTGLYVVVGMYMHMRLYVSVHVCVWYGSVHARGFECVCMCTC